MNLLETDTIPIIGYRIPYTSFKNAFSYHLLYNTGKKVEKPLTGKEHIRTSYCLALSRLSTLRNHGPFGKYGARWSACDNFTIYTQLVPNLHLLECFGFQRGHSAIYDCLAFVAEASAQS